MSRKLIVFTALFLCIAAAFAVNEHNVFVFGTVEKLPTVVLDPGHGGIDGGAVGVTGVMEKELNLSIAERAYDLFGLLGVNCVMTRTSDSSIHKSSAKSIRDKKISDIKNRVAMISDISGARLISIHMNHFSGASCHGAQVFYSKNYEAFAKAVQQAMIDGLDTENHRVAARAPDSVYLMSHVGCPAILVECGFLSNPIEEKKLIDENYQKRVALCIATGYLSAEKLGM